MLIFVARMPDADKQVGELVQEQATAAGQWEALQRELLFYKKASRTLRKKLHTAERGTGSRLGRGPGDGEGHSPDAEGPGHSSDEHNASDAATGAAGPGSSSGSRANPWA